MTIPSTPAKGKTWLVYSREHNAWWGPDRSGYKLTRSEAGRYTREEAERICSKVNRRLLDATDDGPSEFAVFDIDPHLAEQWEELRKARHEAEIAMLQSHKRDDDANVVIAPHLFMAWSKAATNLALFETQHQIGGGT